MPPFSLPTAPTNIIFTGVAGTGKTQRLLALQRLYDEVITTSWAQWRQQHLREYSWCDAICAVLLLEQRMMSVPEMMQHRLIQDKMDANGRRDNVNKSLWAQLNSHAHPASKTVNSSQRSANYYFDKTESSHWYLLPEAQTALRPRLAELLSLYSSSNHSSSNHCSSELADVQYAHVDAAHVNAAQANAAKVNAAPINTAHINTAHIDAAHNAGNNAPNDSDAQQTHQIKRSCLVSFHQAYGYDEFVEGIRPHIHPQTGQMQYTVQQGAFLQLCAKASADPTHRYAMLIDEINRANTAQVFGELMSVIEPTKRLGTDHAMTVRLAYSGRQFGVPANVDIYATMNTQDHSLAHLDMAFRRRFEFIDCAPDPSLLPVIYDATGAGVDLAKLMTALNQRLAALLGTDAQLGHSYFMHLPDISDLAKRLLRQVIPQIVHQLALATPPEQHGELLQRILYGTADITNVVATGSCLLARGAVAGGLVDTNGLNVAFQHSVNQHSVNQHSSNQHNANSAHSSTATAVPLQPHPNFVAAANKQNPQTPIAASGITDTTVNITDSQNVFLSATPYQQLYG